MPLLAGTGRERIGASLTGIASTLGAHAAMHRPTAVTIYAAAASELANGLFAFGETETPIQARASALGRVRD